MARIELTKIEPRAATIRDLAKALKVSADYLLELDDKQRRLRVAKPKNDRGVSSKEHRHSTSPPP
jgi:transcriptional regulator with XRE-family HTH domain